MKCSNCGNDGETHNHHILGRKNDPRTIPLCPNCHAQHHRGISILYNSFTKESVDRANVEIDELSLTRFVSINEQEQILNKYGYAESVTKYKHARKPR